MIKIDRFGLRWIIPSSLEHSIGWETQRLSDKHRKEAALCFWQLSLIDRLQFCFLGALLFSGQFSAVRNIAVQLMRRSKTSYSSFFLAELGQLRAQWVWSMDFMLSQGKWNYSFFNFLTREKLTIKPLLADIWYRCAIRLSVHNSEQIRLNIERARLMGVGNNAANALNLLGHEPPENEKLALIWNYIRADLLVKHKQYNKAKKIYRELCEKTYETIIQQKVSLAKIASIKDVATIHNRFITTTIGARHLKVCYRIVKEQVSQHHEHQIFFGPRSYGTFHNVDAYLDGTVIAERSYLLQDLKHLDPSHLELFFPEYLAQSDSHFLYIQSALPRYSVSNNAFLLNGLYWNYYHWLFESISSLAVLDRAPGGISGHRLVMLQSELTAWQKETLLLLGVDPQRVILAGKKNTCFQKINVAGLLSSQHITHPDAVHFLRRRIAPWADHAKPIAGKRIFVTRKMTAGRKTTQLDKFEKILLDQGFQIADTGNISILAQARLFSEAEIVIGLGGAALSNLAFCSREARVILIVPDGGFSETFTSITAALNIKTWVVLGEMIARTPTKSFVWTIPDFSIPVEDCQLALNEALAV